MPVAYTPPEYVPPEVSATDWVGAERRSSDPVNQLGRSLNSLCLEATDRYEIVAHLEALGYNSPTALKRLGFDNHFDLASELFRRTPRRAVTRRVKSFREHDALTPIAMALTFVITFALGAFSSSAVLVPAILVLVWSQVGAALLAKAHGELELHRQPHVLALIMVLGLLGVGAVWGVFRFGLDVVAPLLLWYAAASLLWARRFRQAVALPVLAGVVLALSTQLGLAPLTVQSFVLVAVAVFCTPLLRARAWEVAPWFVKRIGVALYPTLYGAGQGLLIVALLQESPVGSAVAPGASLLVAILLVSRRLLLMLKDALTDRLWRETGGDQYRRPAQRAVVVYTAVYLLPVVSVALISQFTAPQAWFFHWHAFGVFGLCLGLAVVSFTLGAAAAPAFTFLTAGVAALLGVPFLVVCALLATVQLLLLLQRIGRVERYAVYLLY